MHEVNLGVALRRTRGGVDVVATEVASELEGLGDGQVGQVLVAEGHDLALGDEARQLVLAGGRELGELDAPDLGAGLGRQVGDGHSVAEKLRVGWVGVLAVLDVLEGFERGVLLLGVPGGEVVGVLLRNVRR